MKKFITLSLMAMAASGTMAQSGLHLGVKGGLNISNVIGDNDEAFASKSKIGAHLGPMVNFGFGDDGNFSILGELLFDMKGAKTETVDANGSAKDAPLALNYIDIPILARYRFNFGMYLEAGIYFGFLMGASFDGENEFPDGTKLKDSYNGSDLGWNGGIGYISSAGWGVGYRACLGLKDITKDEDFIDFIALNTCTQISFMYYLGWED